MRSAPPRVAFFTDSFHEVNGVARTSRQLIKFAQSRNLPMLAVHAGREQRIWTEGSVTHCEFRRGFPSLRFDPDMAFDLAFALRHLAPLRKALRGFEPDVIHTTGPSDCGFLGMLLAHQERVPMLSSWHTNLHEYAAQRIPAWIPARAAVAKWTEDTSLRLLGQYYRYARRTLAPNPELVELVSKQTGKPSGLMERGIDTALFHPVKRMRELDTMFRIGYVGRLSREKNVRMLVEIQALLQSAQAPPFQFCIVGQGDEQQFLERHLQDAFFRGVLHGEALSRAYADFDVFVFPSETDTYGNVVLEALASGVPALVSTSGGPKFLVKHDETGFVCSGAAGFAAAIGSLMANRQRLAEMRGAARRSALSRGWDSIFEKVYANYALCLEGAVPRSGDASSAARPDLTETEPAPGERPSEEGADPSTGHGPRVQSPAPLAAWRAD